MSSIKNTLSLSFKALSIGCIAYTAVDVSDNLIFPNKQPSDCMVQTKVANKSGDHATLDARVDGIGIHVMKIVGESAKSAMDTVKDINQLNKSDLYEHGYKGITPMSTGEVLSRIRDIMLIEDDADKSKLLEEKSEKPIIVGPSPAGQD